MEDRMCVLPELGILSLQLFDIVLLLLMSSFEISNLRSHGFLLKLCPCMRLGKDSNLNERTFTAKAAESKIEGTDRNHSDIGGST